MPIGLPVTDPVLVFALAMLIILVAPVVFTRLRIPGLVGLIVTGAIVGPTGIGLLERNETFELLGTVGLLYLMFVAGLSIDLNQFAKLRTRSLVFGLASFLIPQTLALVLGTLLLDYDLPRALLLGSIVGSHTLIAYPIASRLGITKNTAVVMTMGGTMVADVLSLLILAIVVALIEGAAGLGFWLQFALLVLLYAVGVVVLLPRLGRWFFRTVRKQADVEFVFLVAVVFLVAYLANWANLAPIIGAFLAGLVMNRLVPENSPLMTRVRFVGNALFIPFFLISVGMLVDLAVLVSSLGLWGRALLFTGLVLGGKLAAAKLVQRIYGYTPEEGWVTYGLSTPQAAATLAVTLIGFELGLFDGTTVNAVIVMILLTSLVGPSVVERFGRKLVLQEAARPYEPTEAPQRILVPLANPEHVEDLVDIALLIHDPTSEQPIYPLVVVRDDEETGAQVAAGEQLLSQAIVHAAAADVPVQPLTRIDLNVANGITRALRENRIATVIIGWTGQAAARTVIFGSVLDQLLAETHEMVVVCKVEHPLQTARRVLLVVPPLADREPGFGDALQSMKILANQAGLDLVVVGTQKHLVDVMTQVQRIRPEVPVRARPLERWSGLLALLETTVDADDLLVLLMARRGAVAWRPSLDRLPRLLAQRFPRHNFLATYLADVPARSLVKTARAAAAALAEAIETGPVILDLAPGAAPDVLALLLHETAHVEGSVLALARTLAEGEPHYAPELLPGVVLYHAHTDRVDQPLLLTGISQAGLILPRTSHPVHVVLVFLGDRQTSVDAYLQQLTIATHLVPSAEAVETLRTAASPEAVRQVLLHQLKATSDPESG